MTVTAIFVIERLTSLLSGTEKKNFRFISLQSISGKKIRYHFHLPENINTVILIDKGIVHTESDAIFLVLRKLPTPWKLFIVFIIIPKGIRNNIYRWIARNRYKWFGKRENCRIPQKGEEYYFPDMVDL